MPKPPRAAEETCRLAVRQCHSCFRVMDAEGRWRWPERSRSQPDARPARGLCPACAGALYPDVRLGLLA